MATLHPANPNPPLYYLRSPFAIARGERVMCGRQHGQFAAVLTFWRVSPCPSACRVLANPFGKEAEGNNRELISRVIIRRGRG